MKVVGNRCGIGWEGRRGSLEAIKRVVRWLWDGLGRTTIKFREFIPQFNADYFVRGNLLLTGDNITGTRGSIVNTIPSPVVYNNNVVYAPSGLTKDAGFTESFNLTVTHHESNASGGSFG